MFFLLNVDFFFLFAALIAYRAARFASRLTAGLAFSAARFDTIFYFTRRTVGTNHVIVKNAKRAITITANAVTLGKSLFKLVVALAAALDIAQFRILTARVEIVTDRGIPAAVFTSGQITYLIGGCSGQFRVFCDIDIRIIAVMLSIQAFTTCGHDAIFFYAGRSLMTFFSEDIATAIFRVNPFSVNALSGMANKLA